MATNVKFVAKNGLDNNAQTITNIGVAGSSLSQAGAFSLVLTTTGATNVTFPLSGTLATTGQLVDTNWYPSALSWNAGTTAGPVPSITMAGGATTPLTGSAIPAAGTGASGIVTTGSQSFDGQKTFNGTVIAQSVNYFSTMKMRPWTATDTDIDGLISGTTAGALIEAPAQQHITIGLPSNDIGDGFQIISKGAATTPATDPYITLVFEAKANGNITWAGTATGNGSGITTLNASNLASGTVPDARISGSYTGMTNLTGTGTVDFSVFLGNAADTVSTPSFSWTGDTTTGIYHPAASQLGITIAGVQRGLFSATGLAITGVASQTGTPTASTHLVTKQYVDDIATGLDMKASVRVATTANITLSGTQTIDGVAVVDTNRVLVKNQTLPAENGIYVVAAGAWARSTDADNSPVGEVTSGMYCFVEEGTTNGNTGWVLTTDGTITLGTTSLAFVQFTGLGQVSQGSGISISGSTISHADTSSVANVTASGRTYVTGLTFDTYGHVTGTTTGTETVTDTNWYPTAFTWYGGTTAGPTGGLTGVGMTGINIPAIPAAGNSGSGIVTSAAQSFGGQKTFTSPIILNNTFNIDGSAAEAQQTGLYVADLGAISGTTLNPTYTAAILAQISTARSIGITVDTGGYLYGFRTHNVVGPTYTWQSKTKFADDILGGTAGQLLYQNGVDSTAYLATGTAGQALLANGAAAPVWTTLTLENLPGAFVKKAVKAATTANITLSAPQTIDGVAVVAGDRVLVKNQTTTSQNGIYLVAAGAWTRSTDADTASEIAGGLVTVDLGTAQKGRLYTNSFGPTDVLGTTAMTWSEIIDADTTQSLTNKTINASSVGATTRSTGAFTSLTSNAATTFTAGTASTTTGTGTLVVTGGVGISENLRVGGGIHGNGANITALDAGNLATGTVSTARLGSGTANSTTFLRGDGTWAAAGAGTVTSVSVTTANGVSGTSTGGATPALSFTLGAITPSSVISAGALVGQQGVTFGSNAFPTYEVNLDFGNDLANTWRKIVGATLSTIVYSTHGFIVDIVDSKTNHATTASVNTVVTERYYVAMVRTEGDVLDTPDACYVTGPGNRVRAIKTATGVYEIQVQNEGQYREYKVTVSTYVTNALHTITYFAGTTGGTPTAIYNSVVSTATDRFQRVDVAATTASTTTTTGALTVAGGIGAVGQVTAARFTATSGGTPALRIKDDNSTAGISALLFTDVNDFYILLTNAGDANGTYNTLRPFAINKTTGQVTIQHGLTANGTIALSPISANVTISPTGTGTVTLNPAAASTINNMSIGATTRSTGAFTTLTSNSATTFTAGTASTTTGTGTLVVTGGVGVSGAVNAGSMTLGAALPISSGGTGATTAQSAMNALAGAVTLAQYLRGTGSNVVMSAIQASDIPTLNQNTTGSAGSAINVGTTNYTTTGVQYIPFVGSSASGNQALRVNAGLQFNTNGGNAGTLTCSGDIVAFSDERVKTNVEVISNALQKVEQVRGVTFDRKDAPGQPRSTGVIAQELEKVLPEAVRETEDGMKSVAYGNIVGLLIEAVKELSAQNQMLSQRIKLLEGTE